MANNTEDYILGDYKDYADYFVPVCYDITPETEEPTRINNGPAVDPWREYLMSPIDRAWIELIRG